MLENLAEESMIDAFAGTYIIGLNTSQWGNDPYYAYQEFEISKVPAIFELTSSGQPTGRMLDSNAWEGDPENMVPVLKAFFQVDMNTQEN